MYADETKEYDGPVFRQRGFLDTLKAALPTLQAIVSLFFVPFPLTRHSPLTSCLYDTWKTYQVKKIDKRKDPTLRQQAEEVQSNLAAFIEYRKSFI